MVMDNQTIRSIIDEIAMLSDISIIHVDDKCPIKYADFDKGRIFIKFSDEFVECSTNQPLINHKIKVFYSDPEFFNLVLSMITVLT